MLFKPPPPPKRNTGYKPQIILPGQREDERRDKLNRMKVRKAKRAIQQLVKRGFEAMKLYSPLDMALKFHMTDEYVRLVVGSNRSGKTQACCAELVWAVTGTHPWIKYPKENGIFYVIGADERSIREIIWPKLGLDGAFKKIRDEHTNAWRTVLPEQEYDNAYSEKWKDAPPFLPERWIVGGHDGMSWYSKKEGVPKTADLKNGWKIKFFMSGGKPQKGSNIDGAWFDEEIENGQWIPETEARCMDRLGHIFWSFTPEVETELAYTMHMRALQPDKEFDIAEFNFLIKDNQFIPEKNKIRFRKGLRTRREIDTKWHGKFALTGMVVYPEYNEDDHLVDPFQIPPWWNLFMVVDPGVQVCAVDFFAVPPPWQKRAPDGRFLRENEVCPDSEFYGNDRFMIDELYIKRCSARIFGKTVADHLGPQLKNKGVRRFYIDHQRGQQTDDSEKTIEEQYSEALQDNGVEAAEGGTSFTWGTTDTVGREGSLRNWLEASFDSGRPKLRIFRDRCPMYDWEMKQQFYKKENGVVTDKRRRKNDHLVDCAEYFADADPDWTEINRTRPPTEQAVLRKLKEIQSSKKGKCVSLGPKN